MTPKAPVDWRQWAREIDIQGPPRAVLNALVLYADQDGKCWPSLSTLTKMSGVSLSTVKRGIKTLREKNIIDASRGKGRRSNTYQFVRSGFRLNQQDARSRSRVNSKRVQGGPLRTIEDTRAGSSGGRVSAKSKEIKDKAIGEMRQMLKQPKAGMGTHGKPSNPGNRT